MLSARIRGLWKTRAPRITSPFFKAPSSKIYVMCVGAFETALMRLSAQLMCARHFHWVTIKSLCLWHRIPRPPWDAARIFLYAHTYPTKACITEKKTADVYSWCFNLLFVCFVLFALRDRRPRAAYFQFYAAERYEMSIWTGPGAWPNSVLCDKRREIRGDPVLRATDAAPFAHHSFLIAAPRKNANSGAKNWKK